VGSLIVDGRSYDNVNSTTLVDNLELKTEPHPYPYSIQWLNQGKELKIYSRCLVSSPLARVTLMSFSVTYLLWMLAMSYLGGHGYTTARSLMMDSPILTAFTKMAERSPSYLHPNNK